MRHRAYLMAWILAGVAPLLHAVHTIPVPTDPASGVVIEIDSWLEYCPPSGMMPLEIKVTNGSSRTHDWTLTARDGYGTGAACSVHLVVEPGRTVSAPLYATVMSSNSAYSAYRSLNLSVQGHGVSTWMTSLSAPPHTGGGGSGKVMEFMAMSKGLGAKGWIPMSERFEKAKSGPKPFEASQVEMAKAPDDWRGYSGLAQLWMTDSEWLGLGAGARAAIMDWMTLGGRTVIFCTDATGTRLTELKLPEPDAKGERRHGAGELRIQVWDGKSFPLDAAVSMAEDSSLKGNALSLAGYNHWSLSDVVGRLQLHSGLIFGFILAFGILVGPVNLFWLAGPRRRHRLFWTTPLLSLAASALLVALMFLQDGLGGKGARRVLAVLQPEQKKAAIIQEQVSRTGVLLGRTFAKTEPSWMQSLALDSSGSGFNPGSNYQRQLNEDEHGRSGDWFASRAVQAQFLATVRPTRGVIDVFAPANANDAPSVVSSIAAPLLRVFVVDEKNNIWQTDNLGTGEKKMMRACDQKEFTDWMDQRVMHDAGPMMKQTLEKVRGRSG
ncbi:MAG: hypothetical protein WCN98_09190, partial [Verrucomicrobiaceae bacterium]